MPMLKPCCADDPSRCSLRGLLLAGLAVLVTLLVLAAPARAERQLRLCLNQEMDRNDSGKLAYALMAQVGRQLPGLRLSFTPLPWARCLRMAEQGEFDGVLAGSFSAERARSLHYPLKPDGTPDASLRMFNLGFVLMRRSGHPIEWDGERFLHADGPIGVQRGYSVAEFLRERKIPVDDGNLTVQGTLNKLIHGRVAGALVNPFNADMDTARLEGAERLEMVGPLIQKKPYFLIFSRQLGEDQPALCQEIWRAVEQARGSAEFRRLYELQLAQARSGLVLSP